MRRGRNAGHVALTGFAYLAVKGNDSPGPGVYDANNDSTFSLWQRSGVGQKRFAGTGMQQAAVAQQAAARRAKDGRRGKSKLPPGVVRSLSPSHKVPRAYSFAGRPVEPSFIEELGTAREVPGPLDYKPAMAKTQKGPACSFGRDLRFWEHPLLNRAPVSKAEVAAANEAIARAKRGPTAAEVAAGTASLDGLPSLALPSLSGPRRSRETLLKTHAERAMAARCWGQELSDLDGPAWAAFSRVASPPTKMRVKGLIEEKAKANEAVRQRYLVERQRFRQQQMTNRARQRASGQTSPEAARQYVERKQAAAAQRALEPFLPRIKAQQDAAAEAVAEQMDELDAFEDHLRAIKEQGTLEDRLMRELKKLERMRGMMSWRRFFKKLKRTQAFADMVVEGYEEKAESDSEAGEAEEEPKP